MCTSQEPNSISAAQSKQSISSKIDSKKPSTVSGSHSSSLKPNHTDKNANLLGKSSTTGQKPNGNKSITNQQNQSSQKSHPQSKSSNRNVNLAIENQNNATLFSSNKSSGKKIPKNSSTNPRPQKGSRLVQ